jgi:hypothetical protein
LVYKLFGQNSDVLINVFEIKLTVALEVDRNIQDALKYAEKIMIIQKATTGEESIEFLNKLHYYNSLRNNCQIKGTDMLKNCKQAVKIAETIIGPTSETNDLLLRQA